MTERDLPRILGDCYAVYPTIPDTITVGWKSGAYSTSRASRGIGLADAPDWWNTLRFSTLRFCALESHPFPDRVSPKQKGKSMIDIRTLVDGNNTLGEGPLWDVAEQRLYWIDSMKGLIFRATADGRELETWTLPSNIGSMALRTQGGALDRKSVV